MAKNLHSINQHFPLDLNENPNYIPQLILVLILLLSAKRPGSRVTGPSIKERAPTTSSTVFCTRAAQEGNSHPSSAALGAPARMQALPWCPLPLLSSQTTIACRVAQSGLRETPVRAPGVPPGKKDTSVCSVGDAGSNRLFCRTLGLTAQCTGSFHRQTEFPDKEAASIAEHRTTQSTVGAALPSRLPKVPVRAPAGAGSDVRRFFPPPSLA